MTVCQRRTRSPLMRFFIIAGIWCTAYLLASAAARGQCALEPNCVLVWSDEFDGGSLDTSKWEAMVGDGSQFGIPGWGNNELQWYSPNNATVANGVLKITATDQPSGNKNYTSARLRTLGKGDWTYGRFEMRAKLPVGQGMWPAFWMLSSVPQVYGVWAASGEIDIMESLGNDPERILGTIHYGATSPGNVFDGEETRLAPATAQEFHVYAVEWQEGQIRWYVDGQLFSIKEDWWTTGGPFPAPFDVDFHLLLNLAVGGNLPGPPDASTVFPQEFIIDYVRVYDLPDQPALLPELLFASLEHGSPFSNGWFSFNGSVGGGGIELNNGDLPPQNGGLASLQTGWGSGGTPGFYGGFGRDNSLNLTNMTHFSFWINPDAGQDYTLEFNLQEDDNGDGAITTGADDEFQFNCVVSPSGPCAISGGGWQKITVPLTDFASDNSFLFGGNDILDARFASAGGNGALETIVVTVIGNSGGDVSFRTDNWVFENLSIPDSDGDGIADSIDNCTAIANADQRDSNGDGHGNVCDGDFNDDCIVNLADLALFRQVFFTTDADVDLSGDGIVNLNDLAIFRSLFFAPPGPSATQCGS